MRRETIGLLVGVILFLTMLILPTPVGMNPTAMRAAAVALLMATWWITEAIPIYATALIPLALYPFLGILSAEATGVNYGHKYVLMLLAGFLIARAVEVHQLHLRIALMTIKLLGTSKRQILFSFMVATALLSMWMANVAVALMMLPIGLAILQKSSATDEIGDNFSLALMIAIAYAASIGGIGTLVGTPPNMVFAGAVAKFYPQAPEIGFLQWFLVGAPLVVVFLPVTWLYLVKYFAIHGNVPGSRDVVERELRELGKMTPAEKRVAIVFVLTALAWILRRDLQLGTVTIHGWAWWLGIESLVHDSTVAVLAAVVMFILPSGKSDENGKPGRLLDWRDAHSVPWGVVMIVGGGYAIAHGLKETGLADYIATQIAFLSDFPAPLIVLFVVFCITFLTEINSNTATSNIFLPILASMAAATATHPFLLMIPATFACSCAFMLPSGTGPNAVVFGSNRVTIPQMARCGLWLNFIAIAVVTIFMYFVAVPVFGMGGEVPDWAK